MNAFEELVMIYLRHKGYWVIPSVKVDITKRDKREIGKPSMPRPEIDLVAYKAKGNTLFLIEAKSYLDSYGVGFEGVSGKDTEDAKRYKLFTEEVRREIVSKRLREDFINQGLINEETKINYGLAAGKTYSDDEQKIQDYFSKKGWLFISPTELKKTIRALEERGWEDNIATITAKLILR